MPPYSVRIIVACAALSIAGFSQAQKADDAKMAREALAPFVNTSVAEDKKLEHIEESHTSIRSRAAENPNKELSVAIVLNRGQSIEEIDVWAREHKLEIIDLHLKAPYNDKGAVQSFKIGSAELARYDGDFVARANKSVSVIRYRLHRMSNTMPDDVAKEYRRLSLAELPVYRVEAYARASKIKKLLDLPHVTVVFAEADDRGDEKIAFQKRMRQRAAVGWQRIKANGPEIKALREKHKDKLERKSISDSGL